VISNRWLCLLLLGILSKRSTGQVLTAADWQKSFASEPFMRLKEPEASMHRDFTDEDFKTFVLTDRLLKQAPHLRRTLDAWKKSNMSAIADRILPYLPADASIKATVYSVIKPKSNSFVLEADTSPAIFLYLDPEQSESEFENIVAHESHHIGFSDADKQYKSRIKSLPENARKAAKRMGAFGEGLAVLAAAGFADAVGTGSTAMPPSRDAYTNSVGIQAYKTSSCLFFWYLCFG
jgi:Putative zinc dependent peptidase (DUF5700)